MNNALSGTAISDLGKATTLHSKPRHQNLGHPHHRKVLLKQASSAIPKAVNDDDMTTEDATALGNLLEQSTDGLTSDGLTPSVAFLTTACAMFN